MEYVENSSISLNFIKKEPMSGSYKGMRYVLRKSGDEIEVCIWPEPYNFLKTADELKQFKTFELSAEGKDQAVAWLNEQYDVQRGLWDKALSVSWV